MSRAAYHREYYARTAARRRKLAREHQETRRWIAWLVDELFAERILHSPYKLYVDNRSTKFIAEVTQVTKMKLNPNQKRQGDVLLEWLEDKAVITAARLIEQQTVVPLAEDKDGSITLAYGEVTGHRHRFVCHPDGGSDAISYAHPVAPAEPALVHIMDRTALRHEEHGFIESPPGIVRISRPYEYVGRELIRRVED